VKNKWVRRILWGITALTMVFLLVVMPAVTVMVYKANFDVRYGTFQWDESIASGYDGLQMECCWFPSDKGQMLAGAKYSRVGLTPRGLIVMAHGFGGGGHTGYIEYIDYFTANGYAVFAYDATGNDKSEGEVIGGLPQGVIDLDYALDYVRSIPDYDGLPLLLFGHSWGAYSVGNVLNVHPEVQGVVMEAGFNAPVNMIRQEGRAMVGDAVDFMLPYVRVYEWLKYGKYAGFTALKGLENTDVKVMILHGGMDRIVLAENGYDLFYEKFSEDDRFEFLWYPYGTHSLISYGNSLRQDMGQTLIDFYDSCIP